MTGLLDRQASELQAATSASLDTLVLKVCVVVVGEDRGGCSSILDTLVLKVCVVVVVGGG